MKQSEVLKKFSLAKDNGTLTHAYLIESTNQNTLENCATEIVLTLFCENNSACHECKTCKQILDGTFLQMRTLGNGSDHIKKQEVSDLIQSLSLGNIGLDQRKVYLIKNAEQLGLEAGNTLLKTLEEPPNKVTAILLTQSRGEVLSTIRSRCQLFFLDEEYIPLVENAFVDLLQRKAKDELFSFGAKMRKMNKKDLVNMLYDAQQKIILKDFITIADEYLATSLKIKKANNVALLIENLLIKIYEVL